MHQFRRLVAGSDDDGRSLICAWGADEDEATVAIARHCWCPVLQDEIWSDSAGRIYDRCPDWVADMPVWPSDG